MKKSFLLIVVIFLLFNFSSVIAQTIPDSIKQKVQRRIDTINQIIKEKGYKWKAGVTNIAYLSDEEFKRLCGLKISESEREKISVKQDSLYKEYKNSKKDKINKILTVPNWQGLMSGVELQSCGNCWAHAATGVAEGLLHNYLGYNAVINLDEIEITNNASCGNCNGTDSANCGIKYINGYKVRSQQGLNSFPNYDNAYYTISSYSNNTASINAIKASLQYSPVLAAMDVYQDFQLYQSGQIYQHTSGSFVDGHVVVIVSYNEDNEYWICKNSWGEGWGNGGYFNIKFGECGIDTKANVTATVTQSSCIAKLIPNFFSFNDAMNGSYRTNEWAYLVSNTTFSSNYSIPSSARLTIPSNITLTYNSGTFTINGGLSTISASLIFNNSSVFVINGSYSSSNSTVTCSSNATVNVAGSVSGATFQGNGGMGSWSGINIQGTSSVLTSCIIKDAQYGVHCNGTRTYLHYTKIQNCTRGVNCEGSAYPDILPNDVFTGNNYDVYGDNSSTPNMGIAGGYLSFRNTQYYNVYSSYPGTIYARGNYWGSCPPSPVVTGNVDYSNYLCSDPNPSIHIINNDAETGVKILTKKSAKPNSIPLSKPEPGMDKVDKAYLLFQSGNYSEALNEFEQLTDEYPDNFAGNISLVFTERCLENLNRSGEIFDRLNTISQNNKGKGISKFADFRKVYQYINQAKYIEAAEQSKGVINSIGDTTIVKFCLYDLGTIYWNYLNDKKTGEQYFRELVKIYPDDPLSVFALVTLGEWKPQEKGFKIQQPASSNSQAVNLDIQNYPNPFNPVTIIEYQIPKTGFTTLKIYDILGKEVAALINEMKEPGSYSIPFNASNLSSGAYFYRLTINPGNGETQIFQQKMMRVIK